jgi:hypothetical protein
MKSAEYKEERAAGDVLLPTSEPRRIIQIAACSVTDSQSPECAIHSRLHALCNDGTVWRLLDGEWVELIDIPQPNEQEKQ